MEILKGYSMLQAVERAAKGEGYECLNGLKDRRSIYGHLWNYTKLSGNDPEDLPQDMELVCTKPLNSVDK